MVLNLTFVCVDFLYGIALFIKFTLPRQFLVQGGGGKHFQSGIQICIYNTLTQWMDTLSLVGLEGGHVTTNQHVIARDMMLQYKLLFSVWELEALTLTCFFPDDKPTKQ